MNQLQKTPHHYSVKPVTLTLGPSRWLAFLFMSMGVLAGISIILLPWAWWLKAICLAGIAAAVARQVWRDAWRRHPASPAMIELDHAGKLWLATRNGMRYPAQVLGSTLVMAGLVVLNLKLEHGKVSCVILPDAVDAEAFRRLRVWLCWWRETTDDAR
ncbi:protein YgfX [Methylobacillus sp.]|uniref:protein YgfX n=1 Tax=Methylobacillus sp. TaxID=56818 RepID=UPI0012CA23F7|nr:protein YgfX [Methylobacillus sp.]MPS48600.1 hypothetical protein [Methylobacillus sp.]